MKKLVFIVCFILIFGSCFAQNSNNDVQRIIGKWQVENVNAFFSFNADGTFTFSGVNVHNESKREGNYFIANSKLILRVAVDWGVINPVEYYLSADGRYLVIHYGYFDDKHKPQGGYIWLTKQ